MTKLIHVKKHLRKGKVVKSHSRKATKEKKRNLAVTVASKGSKANAPKPGKYSFDGKKENMAPHDQGVRAGRRVMYDQTVSDRLGFNQPNKVKPSINQEINRKQGRKEAGSKSVLRHIGNEGLSYHKRGTGKKGKK